MEAIINKKSFHEFLMPFVTKNNEPFFINKDIWKEVTNDDEYFCFMYQNNGNRVLNKKYVSRIKCAKDTYFNDGAKKLLGLMRNDNYSKIYIRKNVSDASLTLNVPNNSYNPISNTTYPLRVINVMLYETIEEIRTYILRITCEYDYSNDKNDEILTIFRNINDFGRRIYLANTTNDVEDNTAKSSLTANSIVLKIGDKEIVAGFEPKIDEVENYSSEINNYFLTGKPNAELNIDSSLDDRMFVCASLIDDGTYKMFSSQETVNYICSVSNFVNDVYNEEIDKELYKLFFIDNYSCTCYDKYKRNTDLSNSLYTRWLDNPGSLYGITDYSYIHITGSLSNDYCYLLNNDINIYGDMAVLALMQNSIVLFASNHLTELDKMNSKIVKLMAYVNVINVTNQIQGIEMYNMFKKQLRITENINHLKDQLEAIHEKNNEVTNDRLNLLVLVFSLLSILVNVLNAIGFRLFNVYPVFDDLSTTVIRFAFPVLICLLFWLTYSDLKNEKGKGKTSLFIKIILIIIATILAFTI